MASLASPNIHHWPSVLFMYSTIQPPGDETNLFVCDFVYEGMPENVLAGLKLKTKAPLLDKKIVVEVHSRTSQKHFFGGGNNFGSNFIEDCPNYDFVVSYRFATLLLLPFPALKSTDD